MSGLTFQDDLHIIAKRGDNYINFQAARNDASTPVGYSAWLATDGSHIIMENDRTDTSDITLKYFHSTTAADFQTNWDGRAGLTYQEYNELFS